MINHTLNTSILPSRKLHHFPQCFCSRSQLYHSAGICVTFHLPCYTDNTPQLCPYDGATLTISGGAELTCPPAYLTCSQNTPITSFDSASNIPPSCKHSMIIMKLMLHSYSTHAGCDDSCATCSQPLSPAHCLTCSASLTLRGAAPSVCTTDNCDGGTFLDSSSGNCTGKHVAC